ncbi:prophage-derived uncharacterized protein [Bacillus subtilis]|nr:hypothetical protein B4071_2079 [Bacillus subtilis]QHF58052.1 prophage-derived uncharacterized protein [Bacillus subtilis]
MYLLFGNFQSFWSEKHPDLFTISNTCFFLLTLIIIFP